MFNRAFISANLAWLGSMIRRRGILLVGLCSLAMLISPQQSIRPKVDCNCTKSGDYKTPSSSDPAISMDGYSPNEKYRVTSVPDPPGTHVTVYYGTHIKLSQSFPATDWGFSPNDDAFVLHGLDSQGLHNVYLYNLNPDPDREDEPAIQVWSNQALVDTARLRFSPHGKYFHYAAESGVNNIYLRVIDTQDGRRAFEPPTFYAITSLAGNMAFWGYSQDDYDSSFVLAYLTSLTSYNLQVVNLKSEENVIDPSGRTGDMSWGFSPCGDIYMMCDYNTSMIKLYRTCATEELVDSASATNFIKMMVGGGYHVAVYGDGSTVNVTPNTADDPCPDEQTPVWPQNAELTADHVTPSSLTLHWSAATDNVRVTRYLIFENGAYLDDVSGLTTEYDVSDLNDNTIYHYKVEARDEAGNQTTNGPDLTITTPSKYPTWPPGSSLEATGIGTDYIALRWSEAFYQDGVTGYALYQDGHQIATFPASPRVHTVYGLQGWTAYTFAVQACHDSDCSTDGPSIQVSTYGDRLEVELEDTPDPVYVGSYFLYYIKVTNHAPLGSTGVVITATMPSSGIDASRYTPSQGTCQSHPPDIVCQLGSMSGGQRVVVTIIARAPQMGKFKSLARTSAQEPDLLTFNNSSQQTTVVNWWTTQRLAYGGSPDFLLDPAGKLHLVYVDFAGTQSELHYLTNAQGGWRTKVLAQANIISNAAIARATEGDLYVAFTSKQDTPGSLHQLYVTSCMTDTWRTPTLVWENTTGFWPVQIVLDSQEYVNLAFMEAPGPAYSGTLRHMTNTSGVWTIETIGSSPIAYDYAALAIGPDDRLQLSFYGNGVNYISQTITGTWGTRTRIDTVGGQLEGMATGLLVDPNNIPHVSYVGGRREDHRYATISAGHWITTTLDRGSFSSGGNDITRSDQGYFHISYYSQDSNEIRYAANTSGTWVTETVDIVDYGWSRAAKIALDPNGAPWIIYDSVELATRSPQGTNSDPDGVPDLEEWGPAGSDHNYDGNHDGLPDATQGNVASLHTFDGTKYVTFATAPGLILSEVQPGPIPSPETAPPGASFPLGFFTFRIYGVENGGSAVVTMYLPPGVDVSAYYKFGPSPDNPDPHWYLFGYDGQTGAVISTQSIALHFIDGQRGDFDLQVDGVIIEPGAPGIPGKPVYLPVLSR